MSAERAPAAAAAHARVPNASSLRLVGRAAGHAKGRITPPLGARFAADAPAWAVALGPDDAVDLDSVAKAVPDADELPPGTLLVVLPAIAFAPSLGSRFLAALGRSRSVPRALRATALVARGYVRVAAGVDRASRSDLVWGYAPVTERD